MSDLGVVVPSVSSVSAVPSVSDVSVVLPFCHFAVLPFCRFGIALVLFRCPLSVLPFWPTHRFENSAALRCVVQDVSVHPVEQEMYFVRFRRHVPGQITNVAIPVVLSSLWGCPGYRIGAG